MSAAERVVSPQVLALPAGLRERLKRCAAVAGQVQCDLVLVGGAVRDLLLERPLRDVDLAVVAAAESARPALARRGVPAAVVRHLARRLGRTSRMHVVPLDRDRGVYRLVPRADSGALRLTIDLCTLQGSTLEEDLAARDFTINAMAVLLDGKGGPEELVDPHGGLGDLEGSCLRGLSRVNLRSDPLRLLRAFRLQGELDMVIEPRTASWVEALGPHVASVAGERIGEEFWRLLATGHRDALLGLAQRGLLSSLAPSWEGPAEEAGRRLEVLARWLAHFAGDRLRTYVDSALAQGVPRRSVLTCLTLLGPLDSEASNRFFGVTLRSPRRVVRRAEALLRAAERARTHCGGDVTWGGYFAGAEEEGAGGLALAAAYGWLSPGRRDEGLERWETVIAARIEAPPLLRGEDLRRAGVPQGPDMGRWLRALRRRQLEGTLRDGAAARRWLADRLQEQAST